MDTGIDAPAFGIPMEVGRYDVQLYDESEGVFGDTENVIIHGGMPTVVSLGQPRRSVPDDEEPTDDTDHCIVEPV